MNIKEELWNEESFLADLTPAITEIQSSVNYVNEFIKPFDKIRTVAGRKQFD